LGKGGKSQGTAKAYTTKQKMNIKKLALGFLVFLAYYIVARNVENKVDLVKKLSNFSAA